MQETQATPRFSLPLLALGQAQKELFHNEAIALLEALVLPVAHAKIADPVSLLPDPGDCWVVDSGAAGEWIGHDNSLAVWTEGGWRFIPAVESMRCYLLTSQNLTLFSGGQWLEYGAITAPAGGAIVDSEARSAIIEILDALNLFGLISV